MGRSVSQRKVIKAPYVRVLLSHTWRDDANGLVLVVYLLHAYDYCPDDPMICLCLAIASAGRAMQRQSDNRHHLVVQVCVIIKIMHLVSHVFKTLVHGLSLEISKSAWRKYSRNV